MSFVDNIWLLAHRALDAIAGIQVLRQELLSTWRLMFGFKSVAILLLAYNLDTMKDFLGWKLKAQMPMLGCMVDSTGSIVPDLEDLELKLCRAFFCEQRQCKGAAVTDAFASYSDPAGLWSDITALISPSSGPLLSGLTASRTTTLRTS